MFPNDHLENWFNGQGLWSQVSAKDWGNWIWQLQNRITKLDQLEQLLDLTPEEREGCYHANKKLALAITPYFFNLIDRDNPYCPIRRQVIPQGGELLVSPDELLDPVGEEGSMVAPGIVHRYPDRILFLVTDRCAAYCRYCTRSRLVSNAQDYNFHPELDAGLNYIEKNSEIRDVLLSGGDPLLLSDAKLEYILKRLKAIPHVEFIRIGSRIPVFLPQRITPRLLEILRLHGPVWMSLHVNHPKECTMELKAACDQIAFAGVPMGNQSVLLRGVNDSVSVMQSLVHRLLMMRVRPYYLYQCDLITGSAHLRADIAKGIEIIRGLRGHTTGYAIPQFVVDAPEGGGKVPINPEYVKEITEAEIVMRNFQGDEYRYPRSTPLPGNALDFLREGEEILM
ncbi:MAG: KamA family radical SAM protein [Opitutae bacterium]|jgi:lysine 2,3-aminomutase|nr:KamA family radical SAM protein [Opitutae bacterium]MBT5691750.1 KamA family radical SAM protein [Opitutae bacterium]MBT6461214.1 KamA family radical SAM protein [Opitutae bacterium]MBT6957721.1 KamA family radical SAM protein [Opitutae bacterium]MBT7852598.1 KamA family radical SAM protein [Opitutae bacterium]